MRARVNHHPGGENELALRRKSSQTSLEMASRYPLMPSHRARWISFDYRLAISPLIAVMGVTYEFD